MICRLIPALFLALVAGVFLAAPQPGEGRAADAQRESERNRGRKEIGLTKKNKKIK